MKRILLLIWCTMSCAILQAQSLTSLRDTITKLVAQQEANIGIAIHDMQNQDSLTINGDRMLPTLSTFKFPLAIVVLDAVDKGQLSLQQKIHFSNKDFKTQTHSPIRDKYEKAVDITLEEVLRYTVTESDNIGCDKLIELIGGMGRMQEYFNNKLPYEDFLFAGTEVQMNENAAGPYLNQMSPKASNAILKLAYENKNQLLSQSSYDLLWDMMLQTSTETKRLKGLLPKGTQVAHKTGTAFREKKTFYTLAVNDIGVVFISPKEYYYISVFVTDSNGLKVNEEDVIAQVNKIVWDYYQQNRK